MGERLKKILGLNETGTPLPDFWRADDPTKPGPRATVEEIVAEGEALAETRDPNTQRALGLLARHDYPIQPVEE